MNLLLRSPVGVPAQKYERTAFAIDVLLRSPVGVPARKYERTAFAIDVLLRSPVGVPAQKYERTAFVIDVDALSRPPPCRGRLSQKLVYGRMCAVRLVKQSTGMTDFCSVDWVSICQADDRLQTADE